MHASSGHNSVIQYCWPQGDFKSLQAVGPSPLIIEKELLRKVAPLWLNCSYILRGRPEPAHRIQDWVLEMWGYSIAAASLGIRHSVKGMQIEPNAYAGTKDGFEKGYQIFHYTYGIEYRLNGSPQGFNTIGEWSLDKRHYGGASPPPNLDPPPKQANPSTKWLHAAWNEAITEAGDTWPATNAMGTVGWRREGATADEIQKSALASAVVGSHWTWAGIKTLSFLPAGAPTAPRCTRQCLWTAALHTATCEQARSRRRGVSASGGSRCGQRGCRHAPLRGSACTSTFRAPLPRHTSSTLSIDVPGHSHDTSWPLHDTS